MNLWELADLSTPWCLHVVATLRIADHLAAGKTDVVALAQAAGAHPDALSRVLRHLVAKGVFTQPAPGQFALNDAARGLRAPEALIGLDLNGIGGRMAYAWGTLLSAVRTGKPAYHEQFGRGFWDDLDANPAIAASFDALMGPVGHGTPDPEVLVNPADWESIRTVVDVGGGAGYLLAEILRAHPGVRGTLVDLPRTIERSAGVFAATEVADRATAIGQSFFDPLPAGADLYILKSVIADWPEAEATAVLTRCAEAARPSGRVVVFTGTDPVEASPELLMLVLVGGKAYSFDEFRRMAQTAGLAVTATGKQPTGRSIVECRFASSRGSEKP